MVVRGYVYEVESGGGGEEKSFGDALGDGESVGSVRDSAVARAGRGVFATGLGAFAAGWGVFDGVAFHVPCGAGAWGCLDCIVFALQCRPRLHFGVPLPISG